MNIDISKRLQTIVDLIPETDTIVDIGCDHGYVPISLLMRNKVKRAIAMDVNEGPRKRAEKNIEAYGFSKQIKTRQSNGFERLAIGEANTAIIAGMGGRLVASILTEDLEKTKSIKNILLQPQSDLDVVRKLITEIEYECINEVVVYDDEKFYFMMLIEKSEKSPQELEGTAYSDMELRFGKFLLERKDPVLFDYLLFKQKEFQKIWDTLTDSNELSDRKKERKQIIEGELRYLDKAFSFFDKE